MLKETENTDCQKPHINRTSLGMVMAKIPGAAAFLSPFPAAAAARHGRSSLLTAQNVSFEP